MKIEITIQQLEELLNEQKRIVIEKLAGQSGYYNAETDSSNYRPLKIDKNKFFETGMSAKYPQDLITLKKYISQ